MAGAIVLLAVAAGVFTIVRRGTSPPHVVAQAQRPALPTEISLPGRIQATKVVNVPVPVEGTIDRMMADVGEDVFEGELLAHIKSGKLNAVAETAEADAERARSRVSDLEAALISARLEASRARAEATRTKTEFEMASKVYQRQKLLLQEGATPRLTFEKAEAEYNKLKADDESFNNLAKAAETRIESTTKDLAAARKLAEAKMQELDEAKADLGAGEVHSPVNGMVLARHGQAGEAVGRNVKDLFQIATDLTALQVMVAPEAAILPKIKPGQAAAIQIAEAPVAIQGAVIKVEAGQVFISFTSPLPAIKPGLTAQVKLKL